MNQDEDFHKLIFDSLNDAVYLHDLSGKIFEVNETACRRLGYSRKELLGMSVKDIDCPKFVPLITAFEKTPGFQPGDESNADISSSLSLASPKAMPAARGNPALKSREDVIKKRILELQNKGSIVFESCHLKKGGREHIPVEISSQVITWRGQKGILSIARDISKRKEMEGNLQEKLKELNDAKLAMLNILEDTKALEESLKSERDKMELIVSSMGEGLLVINNHYKVELINQAAQVILGVTTKQAIGKNWSDVVTTLKGDEETPLKERSFTKVVEGGETIIVNLDDNHYYLTREGRKFPIVSITAPLKHANKTIGAVKVFRDATHEKNLEKQLRKERDRANLIITSMGSGLLVIDKDYKVTRMNPTAEKLLAVDSVDVIGEKWYKFAKAYDGDKEIALKDRVSVRVLKTGKTIITRIEDNRYYQTPAGKRFPVASITAPLTGEGGEITGAVKVFRDATAEKEAKKLIEREVEARTKELEKAKDEIKQSSLIIEKEKAQLMASINSLSLGFLICDSKGSIIIMNPAVRRILDLSEAEKTLIDVHKRIENIVDLHGSIEKCIANRKTYDLGDFEYDSRFLHIVITPIVFKADHNVDIIGFVIIFEDITDAKLLERSRDEFFSIASHELRTPLSAIRGNTSLILTHYKDKLPDKDFKEMVDDIHESSVRLIDIVNDFLDMSRLELGRIELKMESHNVVELIREVISEFQVTGSRKKLYIDLENPEFDVPQIYTDRDKLRQVLINLLDNAIKYTKQGGVTFGIKPNDKYLKILVSDTGKGIAEENQKYLFRKFQQAGTDIFTRDATKGTGLGLYISRLMVEMMGGKIKLERSEVDKGSTFSVLVPIYSKKNNSEKTKKEKSKK